MNFENFKEARFKSLIITQKKRQVDDLKKKIKSLVLEIKRMEKEKTHKSCPMCYGDVRRWMRNDDYSSYYAPYRFVCQEKDCDWTWTGEEWGEWWPKTEDKQ